MKKSQRNYHYSWGSIFINRMNRGKEKNSVNEESTEQFKEKVG